MRSRWLILAFVFMVATIVAGTISQNESVSFLLGAIGGAVFGPVAATWAADRYL